jgi:hypothetical protein
MVYTGLVFNHPDLRVTPRQWKKAVDAIQRKPLLPSATVDGLKVVHRSPLSVRVNLHAVTGSPLVDYQPSPSRRAPKEFRTVPEVEGVIDSLRPLIRRTIWTTQNWDILSGTCRGIERSIVPDLELNLEFERKAGGLPDYDEAPEMGLIALIQEAGYKLRFAANPFRVYQAALQPLGSALFDALAKVPNDFTFDQQAGLTLCQAFLQKGYPAASMDLSNATDNAPLQFQLELLSKLGVGTRWLQFLLTTCKGDWWVQTARSKPWDVLRWTVGSPLGLYPTFAAFALWHHAVAQYACAEAGLQPVEIQPGKTVWPYAIVGDDVTFFDWHAATIYRGLMDSWGVPISEPKTLWSSTTAEFLGRVITPNSVIQGFKWKGRVSDESFVDFCRNFGPRALTSLRPRQRRVISWIADLPEPYGLGWNPLGISLEERFPDWLERAMTRDERVRTFSRRSARAHRLLYSSADKSGVPVFGREPDADYLTSDQDVATVFGDLLPYFSVWGKGLPWEAVAGNLSEVALSRDKLPPKVAAEFRLMLQRTSYLEKRQEASTLVVLERKIRRAIARGR